MDCKLIFENEKPMLVAGDEKLPFFAYMTYFTENAHYKDFAQCGYHLYSVCAGFTEMPINSESGFSPFRRGIFSVKGAADYSEFDADIKYLLDADENALIFPRVYLSMPEWWVRENPSEVLPTFADPIGREMLFSDKYKTDCGQLLGQFISHVRQAEYSERIIGYQLSGGNTQEWFHFDHNGSFCANAFPYFCRYVNAKNPGAADGYSVEKFLNGDYMREFSRFANDTVADTIEYFASLCKSQCGGKQIVGTFYGYSLENHTQFRDGGFSMYKLLESKNIDFFSSPFSYTDDRSLEKDLSYMLAEKSVRLHGKAYIVEADIRTHLSDYPEKNRKDIKIKRLYRGSVWFGENNEELTIFQLKRAFAKVITGNGGMWWFDMWGGWYATKRIMDEMRYLRQLADLPFSKALPVGTHAAVMIDETLWERHELYEENIQREFCKSLCASGIVGEIYLMTDFDAIKDKYSLFLFPQPDPPQNIIEYCRKNKIAFLYGEKIKTKDIRAVYAKAVGVPLADEGDIVYEGNGFIAVHAVSAGVKTITLPLDYTVKPIMCDNLSVEHNAFTINIDKYDTVILRIVSN